MASKQKLASPGIQFASLVDLLLARAEQYGDRTACVFLPDGEVEQARLSFRELESRAKAVAAWLQSKQLEGERILLVYPSSIDYIVAFWGCLCAGATAIPIAPPQSPQDLRGIHDTAADAQAALILTASSMQGTLANSGLPLSKIESIEGISPQFAAEWRNPEVQGDSLAVLQYTSGSTGSPKGVMITHDNLLYHSPQLMNAFGCNENTSCVTWLPMYHSTGLFAVMLQAIYTPFTLYFMPPVAFLQRPSRWLQAISRYRATISGGPNFAYEVCLHSIPPELRATLDLSSWETAICGGEAVSDSTLKRFAQAFADTGFREEAYFPCYGLTEATLMVSGSLSPAGRNVMRLQPSAMEDSRVVESTSPDEPCRTIVGCGRVISRKDVAIVDPERFTRRPGMSIGEIWVSGRTVAQGYWNRDTETQHTFSGYLAGTNEGPFLRTGDLGFLSGDELFITGRLKELIIVRGKNHYPQDIEVTVRDSHPVFRAGVAAAFSIEAEGEERLVVVQEIDAEQLPSAEEALLALRQAVAQNHGISPHAAVLVNSKTIPRTYSGKVRRVACRLQYLSNNLSAVSQWTAAVSSQMQALPGLVAPAGSVEALQEKLRVFLASKAGLNMDRIEIERPISQYGLDSLGAIEMMHFLELEAGVKFSMRSLLQGLSIRELAERAFAGKSESQAVDVKAPIEIIGKHPLSYAQQALWFLHQVEPENTAYNIASAVQIKGDLDCDALARAWQAMVLRHPALRTSFPASDGKPVQLISEQATLAFHIEDAGAWSDETLYRRLREEANRPFDLEVAPLLRILLFKRSPSDHVLLLVMHHIITDLWSLSILLEEVSVLYESMRANTQPELPALKKPFVQCIYEQAERLQGPRGENLWKYWSGQLAGTLPVLDLPGSARSQRTAGGASYPVQLGQPIADALRSYSQSQGTTLFMALLAAFQGLLYRYTGQEDVLVGCPFAGREDAAISRTVGYFVNPVVMRASFSNKLGFQEFLKQVQQTAWGAYEHQDFPFPLLVEKLQPQRYANSSPVFQAMFAFEKAPFMGDEGMAALSIGERGAQIPFGNVVMESLSLERQAAQFDLSLYMAQVRQRLIGLFEYNANLLTRPQIERMAGHLEVFLQNAIANPDRPMAELPLLLPQEQKQIVEDWNDTAKPRLDSSLQQMFELQAKLTPQAIAVSFEKTRLIYAELNSKANQLAHYLRKRGIGPEARVGICMERSLDLVVALLGVLKAGAAYVPLDPEYPAARLKYMLDDAGISLLLAQKKISGSLPENSVEIISLDEQWNLMANQESSNPQVNVHPDNLAYVIYTSGSTGAPKAAMNTHRGICNRLAWMQEAYSLSGEDRIMQKTPFSFDVSVWEFFWPLLNGARLVMAQPGGHRDSSYLAELIQAEKITILHFVPSMLSAFLEAPGIENCTSLRHVVCSGEELTADIQQRYYRRLSAPLHNLYGPTEAAVDVTFFACGSGNKAASVPIGEPIANTRIHILDREMQPRPVGTAGELFIGGINLARGYLGRPDLTAERFIPDPFSREPGMRLYRTGDRAQYREDGEIEYLGRNDYQVKIRGYRIELGEIETVITRYPGVKAAVIVVAEQAAGDKRLIAYWLAASESAPEPSELRDHLKQELPDYMVPAVLVKLSAFPLSPNGKIDRKALPKPDTANVVELKSYVAPRSPVEHTLSKIWAELLNVKRVGVSNNFFYLGGHSLLVTQMVSRIRAALAVEIPLRKVFEMPTVAELAKFIEAIQLVARTTQARRPRAGEEGRQIGSL